MATRLTFLVPALLLGLIGVASCGSESSGPTLSHCPKEIGVTLSPGSPGSEGETVKEGPMSVLICRSRSNREGRLEHDETVARGPAISGLVAVLNSLVPGQEGEFACETAPPLKYLLGLRYSDAGETEVEADYSGCPTVRTKDGYWDASTELRQRLDSLLEH